MNAMRFLLKNPGTCPHYG